MRSSGVHPVSKRAPDDSSTDACLCATCERPMGSGIKHCIDDVVEGAFVLCDTCYLGDDRRNEWEYRGALLPKKAALSGARGR